MMTPAFGLLTDYLRFNFHGAAGVAVGFYDLVLGLLVFLQNPTQKLNRSFLLVTIATSIWIASFGMMSLVQHPDDAYLWLAASYFGIPFITPSMYLFTLHMTKQRDKGFRLPLGFMAASIGMYGGVRYARELCFFREFTWGRYPVFRDAAWVRIFASAVIAFFLVFVGLSIQTLFRGYKNELAPKTKTLLRIVLVGFSLAYLGSLDWLTALRVNLYPIGYIALAMLVTAMTYAIFRYQAFEINVLAKKVLAVVMVYAGLAAILLPVGITFLNRLANLGQQEQAAALLVLSCLFGAVLSTGPALYMFLVRHTFWLRHGASTGLVHELKSPIGAIQSALDLLMEDRRSNNGNNVEYLGLIQRNTDRLGLFVNDLLNITRMQEGEIRLQPTRLCLCKLTADVVESYRPQADKKGLTFRVRLQEIAPLSLDESKMRQVISNLLSNALKFTTNGSISIQLAQKNGEVLFSVADTGKGLESSHHERIFERFFQSDPGSRGSGLGLTIAKGWVEAHGGRIWAESPGLGKGTTVTFTLPANQ